MKTYVANPSGYCQGVQRAVALAMTFHHEHPNLKIYILGSLVHNEKVLMELEKMGMHSLLGEESDEEKINKLPNGVGLIFPAHGHDKKLEDICKKKRIVMLDVTCPIVSASRDRIMRALSYGREVIYVGTPHHPETNAMLSLSNRVHLYMDIKDDLTKKIEDHAPFVSNQTTLTVFELVEIFNYIKSVFPNATMQNEVCSATRLRQQAVLQLPSDVDCVFIVGGHKSSNTLRLYEVAKRHFSTLKIYRILDENDIDPKALKGCLSAAIISGASTPLQETMKVKVKLDGIY